MNKFLYLALAACLFSKAILNAAPVSEQNGIDLQDDTSSNWSGFYLGINSGYVWGNAHMKTVASTPLTSGYFTVADAASITENGDFRMHPGGYTGGAQLGYNSCFSNGFALGLETDFGAFLLSTSKSFSSLYPTAGTGEYTLTQKMNTYWLYTLRPRVGFAYKQFFVFLTGGLALTDVHYAQIFDDNSLSAQGYSPALDAYTKASTNKLSTGWTAGAGIEYLFYERLSLSLSYLYASFGSLSNSNSIELDFFDTIYTSSMNNSAKLTSNILRVGLNWKL